MDRRDFLLFRTGPRRRELVLSGEWLYMKWLDAQATATASATATAGTQETSDFSQEGEPPAVFDRRSTVDLFRDLERRLGAVDVVRLSKMRMLTGDLRREFGALLRRFRARGGRVEIDG